MNDKAAFEVVLQTQNLVNTIVLMNLFIYEYGNKFLEDLCEK